MISDSLVHELAAAWDLHVGGVRYPLTGTMNDIAILTTDRGQAVLRGHRRPERERVEFEHQAMDWARGQGLPVPEILATTTADRIVGYKGRWFSLCAYAAGVQVARDDLGRAEAAAMGRCLARLHRALSGFPLEQAPRAGTAPTYANALRRIEAVLDRIAVTGIHDEPERWAHIRLVGRAEWMRDRQEPHIPDPVDEQLVHGDFHDANLFFADDEVSAIIDWDKSEVRSRGQEAIRAMQHSFGFDPALCREFIAGYRSEAPLTDYELDLAAAGYGQVRDCDLWLVETIFLDGDDRPKRFVTPGPFRPFTEIWEPVKDAISSGPTRAGVGQLDDSQSGPAPARGNGRADR